MTESTENTNTENSTEGQGENQTEGGTSTEGSTGNGEGAGAGASTAPENSAPAPELPKEELTFVASVNVYRSSSDGQFFLRYDDEQKEANSAPNASAVGILASQYLADKANFELQTNPQA